jgi:hypothetical protein
MEENKEIILPNRRFKKADDQDLTLKLNLENSESLLRIGDKDITIDVNELYNRERTESINYKIHGKLKMVFRNLYSGTTDYTHLKERLYLVGDGSDYDYTGFLPYDEFAFLRKDVRREVVVPSSVSGSTLGVFTPTVSATGNTYHNLITPISAPYHNWNIYLTYVYSGDTNFPMGYSLSGGTKVDFVSGDGIPFRLSFSGGTQYEFTSPIEHGLKAGEYVTLYGGSLTGSVSGRTFYVSSLGNEYYNSEKYVINISKKAIPAGTTFSLLMMGKRVLDLKNITNTTSTYYVHRHATITSTTDYIMDNAGFESSIWEDEKKILFENSAGVNDPIVVRNRMESVLYDFKEPLQLSGFTNNLGFTPTEVYVTTLLRNGNGYFTFPPKVGHKFHFHNTWIDDHFSGTTSNESTMTSTGFVGYGNFSGHTFYSGNTLPIGTSGLTGAFVEYNPKEMKERIICESFHNFSSPTSIFDFGQDGDVTNFSGASANNLFGLYYQPHHRVKLRELSPYVEMAKTNNVFNLPENANYDEQEKVWRWRDLYDHGYVDVDGYGTNYPFANGTHYVKKDINFYLRNERYYTNKQDEVINFSTKKTTGNDC